MVLRYFQILHSLEEGNNKIFYSFGNYAVQKINADFEKFKSALKL